MLEAGGGGELPAPLFGGDGDRRHHPQEGDIVRVRLRQWVVEEVVSPDTNREDPDGSNGEYVPGMTRVRLAGLDDDNQGRPLEVLWELELGARVIQPENPRSGGGLPPRSTAPFRGLSPRPQVGRGHRELETGGKLHPYFSARRLRHPG